MPKSDPDPLAALTEAVLRLVEEVKRHNDNHEPVTITTNRTAEIYSARYGEEEREKDEMHEILVALEAARGKRRTSTVPKRRSS